MNKIIRCKACMSTGMDYPTYGEIIWTGKNCWACGGFGVVLNYRGCNWTFANKQLSTYRDTKGKFRSVKEALNEKLS